MLFTALATSLLLVPLPGNLAWDPVQDPVRELAQDLAQEAAVATDPFVEFAEKVEATVAEYDGSFLTASFDLEALVETISAGLEPSPAFQRGFLTGMTRSMKLGENIAESCANFDGTYEFLRMMPDQPHRALFRLAGDDGLNYHELHLRRDADGGVRIVDAFFYNTGERFSTTVRRGFVAAATSNDRSIVSKLLGGESDYVASLEKLGELNAAQLEDPERALEIYDGLPESVQQLPEILSIRIQAASLVDDDLYLRALLDFAKFHPDSPALALMMIDAYLLREEFDRALANIDVIDDRVLGDPYLDILRGSILRQAGKLKEAGKRVDRAVERDPGLGYQALWEYLELSLVAGDHPETLRCLVTLTDEHGIEWNDLTEIEQYAAFLASDAGKTWLERE